MQLRFSQPSFTHPSLIPSNLDQPTPTYTNLDPSPPGDAQYNRPSITTRAHVVSTFKIPNLVLQISSLVGKRVPKRAKDMSFCRLSGVECRRPCPRPQPPPPMPRERPVDPVAALNQRWALGHPSNSMVSAGVLMHQFGRTTGLGKRPWVPRNPHVSCSLANRHVPWLYSPSAAGFVLSQRHARVKCLYATDGGTFKTPDGCGQRNRCTARQWWMCNYPPAQLERMLHAHAAHNCKGWNEVVVSKGDWMRALPQLLEAVFFVRGTPAGKARRAHAQIATHFRLPLLPFLSFDPRNGSMPFRRASPGRNVSSLAQTRN